MVKHNNVVPNTHCHKKYLASSRGPLKVRLSLNQASKKLKRRQARAAKAAAIAPRPLQLLRPIVYCPTQRYSGKQRLGRGFTLEECRAAGLSPKYARTIGIAVDHRRYNHSEESLERNVERLKEYLGKIILFPKNRASVKPGEAGPEVTALAEQKSGILMPIVKKTKPIEMMTITDEMKNFKAFTTMAIAKKETKVAGYRMSVKNRKKE